MSANQSDLLDEIRYPYDIRNSSDKSGSNELRVLKDNLYQNGLLIDEASTPLLAEILDGICDKFNIEHDAVSAFICPDPEVQARCISTGTNECVLTFTSGLINLLEANEFAFVAGHELGHHVYNHCRIPEDTDSADYFMQQRAQEISVDRVGLLAAGDLNSSVRALMKTATGLNEKFLKFDTSQFISQIKKVSNFQLADSFNNTHPSMMIRCKALLWFSLGVGKLQFPLEINQLELDKINSRVQSDLIKFVDAPVQIKIEKITQEVKMWSAVLLIMEDFKFDKNEKLKFEKLFGKEALQKVSGFLMLHNKLTVIDAIEERLRNCSESLQEVSPKTYKELRGDKIKEILNHFS